MLVFLDVVDLRLDELDDIVLVLESTVTADLEKVFLMLSVRD